VKPLAERRALMRALLGDREVDMVVMMYACRARRMADHYNESKGLQDAAH